MKAFYSVCLNILFLVGFVSCKRAEEVNFSLLTKLPTSSAITNDTLSGYIKGTMLKDSTYYIAGDIYVNPQDTLAVQEGVHVYLLSNYNFYINGTILSEGSQAAPVFFTIEESSKSSYPDGGAWGGLNLNEAKAAIIRWTHIEYAGGPDQSNDPRYGISVLNSTISPFILEDSWISNTLDDGIRLYGTQNISIKRNSFIRNGGPEGEAINIQLGVTGDFMYNEIWSSATNCMKIYTDNVVKFPQTDLRICNNTYYNTGHRRLQKPGNAILLDRFVRAEVFNNIFVNCKQSLRITKSADTLNTHYGNNLFFTNVPNTVLKEKIRAKFYPAGDWASVRPSDLMDTDPLFTALDTDIDALTNTSSPRPQVGSPIWGNGNPIYNNDIGAFTSDSNGNKH